MGARLEALAVLGAPFALAALTGPPSTALRLSTTADPSAPVVAALGLIAWACCGWLLLVAAAAAAGPRAVHAARWLAPAGVHGLVRVALGATTASVLAIGPAIGPAMAQPPTPPPAATLDLDWPTASPAGSTAAPATPSPSTASHAPPAPSAPSGATGPTGPTGPTGQVVVVRPGESLWRIAARDLGPGATAPQVAAAWPRWWQANRSVVGGDPDLIHPGDRLRRPSDSPTRSTTRGEP